MVQKDPKELIRKVYDIQKLKPTKGDWVDVIENERNELGIKATDAAIATMSKLQFKSIVNIAIEEKALAELNKAASSHSKSSRLIKTKLSCENYFQDKYFRKGDIELLFALKTRMINVKKNFASANKDDIACDICHVQVECQEHLLKCVEIRKHVDIPGDIQYEHLFQSGKNSLNV